MPFLFDQVTELCQVRRPIPQGQESYATDAMRYETVGNQIYEKIYNDLPVIFIERRELFDERGFPLTDAIYYGNIQTKIPDLGDSIPKSKDVLYRRSLLRNTTNLDMSTNGLNHPELTQDRLVITGVESFKDMIRLILINTDKFDTGRSR